MRLDHPKAGQIQQGSVINCIAVPGYEDCNCHGIVLTARCDLAHAKQTVINFAPVVCFSDWLHRGFSYLLAKRVRASLLSAIKENLDRKQVSDFVRRTFPLRDIISKETTGKEQEALLAKCDQLEQVEKMAALGGAFNPRTKQLVEIAGKESKRLIEELVGFKLAEYYFLEAVDAFCPSPEGHVALLRQMGTLSCSLAERIVVGLQATELKDVPGADSQLSFKHDPICMVIGVLRSPDIEHLTQHFASLFGRIGLEDHGQPVVDHHVAIAKGL